MKKKLNLPRVPLPRQTGGAHRDKRKLLDRKRKHKFSLSDWDYAPFRAVALQQRRED